LQIAAEWLHIAQRSQWRAYRKPPLLFRMVPSLTPYDLSFSQMVFHMPPRYANGHISATDHSMRLYSGHLCDSIACFHTHRQTSGRKLAPPFGLPGPAGYHTGRLQCTAAQAGHSIFTGRHQSRDIRDVTHVSCTPVTESRQLCRRSASFTSPSSRQTMAL